MSPTQDYYDWVNGGRRWTAARPVGDLAATLRQLGYTVYILGDESHLTANPPEDHTPFSYTGWPQPATKGVVDALDVMPKNGDMHDLANLARALISMKDANVSQAAFIKYINWTEETGYCYHESWEPNRTTRSSSDKGHIHLSIRSDFENSPIAAGWNPFDGATPVVNPAPPAARPAPTPTYEFPLPRGYYFGYASGPSQSVSGNYGRYFNGRPDHDWLKLFGEQLLKRGWSIGVGKQYLSHYGNDGHYGDEYNKLAKAFQGNQNLGVDGEIGHDTWTAAFHNPVS